MTATEQQTCESASQSSPEALAVLSNCLLRHFHRILMIVDYRANGQVRKQSSIEDLAHEVVVEALRQQTKFEYRSEKHFVRWISTVARRVVSQSARRTEIMATPLSIHSGGSTATGVRASRIPAATETPSSIASMSEQLGQIRSALSRLQEMDREVIGLIHLEGYTVREAAEQIGCSEETAAKRLSRALGRLARELGRECR